MDARIDVMEWFWTHPWAQAGVFLLLCALVLIMWWEVVIGGWDDD